MIEERQNFEQGKEKEKERMIESGITTNDKRRERGGLGLAAGSWRQLAGYKTLSGTGV